MNDSTNKTRPVRSGSRKPATAPASSSGPTPPPDGQNGAPAAPLAKGAPKGAVKPNAAVVASTAPQAKPAEQAADKAVAKPAAKAADKPVAKARKPKLVHGTFALPKDEYAALGDLKKTCQNHGVPVKKTQLLRVAITLLRDLDATRLAPMIAALPPTKRAGTRKGK